MNSLYGRSAQGWRSGQYKDDLKQAGPGATILKNRGSFFKQQGLFIVLPADYQ
jgi:hypothetical protein